jgi:hypothetical protein
VFHDAVLQGKYPQKFTFNFIRQFTAASGLSFNELNLRKCLTIKVLSPDSELTLLQSIGERIDLQSESFLILLKFALDPEGGPSGELWSEKFMLHIKQVPQPKDFLQIARAFIENIEFRAGTYNDVRTEELIKKCGQEHALNLLIYIALRDCRLLELRSKLETEQQQSAYKG